MLDGSFVRMLRSDNMEPIHFSDGVWVVLELRLSLGWANTLSTLNRLAITHVSGFCSDWGGH